MVTAKPKGTYTVADYFATPEGERWELIDGVLYHMAAAPNIKHQTASGNLFFIVGSHVRRRRLGLLLSAPCAVLLPGESAVEPDLLFVSAERRQILTERACEGPPDLVVEILSPSNQAHDLERKRELYARHGIPEYLILEPNEENVLALADPIINAGEGAYRSERLYRPGDVLTIAAIPGLAIAVSDIFAEPWWRVICGKRMSAWIVSDMANLEHLIERHRRLYHVAEAGSWENIRRRGLLSTTALLDLFEVGEPSRTRIEAQYRQKDCVVRDPEYGCATIRRQILMDPDRLRTALTDMKPWGWYRLLNGKVFFWSTPKRLNKFLNAIAHGGRAHDVITVCTRSLIYQYAHEIELSPINSGTVFIPNDPNHQRGSRTFQSIPDYDRETRDGLFAELAVEYRVLDIEQHALSVDRWIGANRVGNIWQR